MSREGRTFPLRLRVGEADQARTLHRLLEEEAAGGRSLWASFNWTERVDLDETLLQQEALGEIVRDAQLVVKTAVLEDAEEVWILKEQRKAQEAHSGTIWFTERGWDSAW